MKLKVIGAAVTSMVALSACMETMNVDGLLGAGGKMMQAYTLSDQEVVSVSDQACAQMDQENKVAAANNPYHQRLQKLAAPLSKTLNGQQPNFKVYQTPELNAWAMANGCIRVYSGLMDKMSDAELQGIIAHEMGHVELGHSKKAMQTAYAISAARDAAASAGNSTVTALSSSQLGEMTESLLNAQFSQSQETAADDYSFDLLTQRNLDRQALVSAFQKLAELDGGQGGMMSSHPGSSARAQRMQAKIDAAR